MALTLGLPIGNVQRAFHALNSVPFMKMGGGGCTGTADSNCVRCPEKTSASSPCTDCRDMYSYEAVPPRSGANTRQCKPLTVCNVSTEYEASEPEHVWSDGLDRACAALTTCTIGEEYELRSPTAYSNRVCKKYTDCPKGYYILHRGTPTGDQSCAQCPEGSGQHAINAIACGPTTPTTTLTASTTVTVTSATRTTVTVTSATRTTHTTVTGTTVSSTVSSTTTVTPFVGFTCTHDAAQPLAEHAGQCRSYVQEWQSL